MRESWMRTVSVVVKEELRHFIHLNPSRRPWQMPLAATIALCSPLIAGLSFDRIELGLIAMLGSLAFLNLPDTNMQHRMRLMMGVSIGMMSCYLLGALMHFYPPAVIIMLTMIAIIANMAARYYRLPPPGVLFLLMAASIAAYTPATLLEISLHVGLVALGALFACIVAGFYSLYHLRRTPPAEAPTSGMDFDYVVVDSVIIGSCVGVSLLLAELLQLERPYWVPVSCLAIIQGASLRMVWNRHLHRIVGTVMGLALMWLLLMLPQDPWLIVTLMIVLSFVIEILVVRHYGLAVIFITPLTIFLAEAGKWGQQTPLDIMLTRMLDIGLGSSVGLVGGALLHVPAFRSRVVRAIRVIWPARG